MGYFDEVNEEVMKESEKNDFGAMDSQLTKAEIQNAYIVEGTGENKDGSPKQSKALVANFKLESGKFHTEQLWFKSGKGISTYPDKKTGKAKYLPSFIDMGYLFMACGLDMNQEMPATKTVKHFGNDIQAPVFENMLGKRIEIGIRKVLKDTYQDSYTEEEINEASYYGTLEGFSGKEVRDKATEKKDRASWEKMIAKKPVKDSRKDSKKEKPVVDGDTAAAVGGW